MYNTKVYETFDEVAYEHELLREFYDEFCYSSFGQISKGECLKIAIIDSGIDYYSKELSSRHERGYNAYKDSEYELEDKNGHGTMVTGLISGRKFGLLPNATVYPIKVSDDNGRMNLSSIIRGIRWAIEKDVDMIVMAITTKTDYNEFHEVIKQATDNNIIVICSAANDSNSAGYPAKYPETIAVAATDYNLSIPSITSQDVDIDFVMPGIDIACPYFYGRYCVSSGSSLATALGAMCIGMILNHRLKHCGMRMSLHQLRNFIKNNSIEIPNSTLRIPTLQFFKECNYSYKDALGLKARQEVSNDESSNI